MSHNIHVILVELFLKSHNSVRVIYWKHVWEELRRWCLLILHRSSEATENRDSYWTCKLVCKNRTCVANKFATPIRSSPTIGLSNSFARIKEDSVFWLISGRSHFMKVSVIGIKVENCFIVKRAAISKMILIEFI